MDRGTLLNQLAELMEKDELKDKFEAVSSREEMRALLRENGMNEDDETLDALLEDVARLLSNDGELNEEDLEDVSGGRYIHHFVPRLPPKWGSRITRKIIRCVMKLFK